jgi:hypothetical protein
MCRASRSAGSLQPIGAPLLNSPVDRTFDAATEMTPYESFKSRCADRPALLRPGPAARARRRFCLRSTNCITRAKWRERRLVGNASRRRLTGVPSVGCRHWRRERDSNPRNRCRFSGFQDHHHRPLGHPSARPFYSEICKFVSQPRCFLGFRADQRLPRAGPCALVSVSLEKDALGSWQRLLVSPTV